MIAIQSRLGDLLHKRQFARGVLLIAGGSVVGQAMIALSSPVLTRLYTVKQLGAFAVYASLLGTTLPIVSLGYQMAVPLPASDEEGINVLAVALAYALLVVAVSMGAVLLFSRQLAAVTGASALGAYLWILPFGLLAAGCYFALSYWEVRKAAFGVIGRTRVVQAGGQVVSQIGLGLGGLGVPGLMFGDVLGRAAGAWSFGTTFFRRDRALLHAVNLEAMRRQANRYRRFPLMSTWSSLANAGGLHLAPFAMAVVYGPLAAGWFAVGQRIMALPSTIIGQAVAQVYLQRAAACARRDSDELRSLFVSTAKRLALFGAMLVVPAAILAPLVFPLVLGPSWKGAGELMQVAGVMYLAQFVVAPLSQTLNVIGRQDLQLIWDVGRLVAMVGVFALGRAAGWSAVTTIGVLAAVMTVAYIGLALGSFLAIGHPGRYPIDGRTDEVAP
jgi:O-antigen/teichoic acid export membrane protein